MNMIKLSVFKNRLSGILSVGHPSFSVVGIPPVPIPIPEEIQLLMYDTRQHLILSYSFEIKQINERTNQNRKMFLSHNNVVFIIKSNSKIFINSLKSGYKLANISWILIDTKYIEIKFLLFLRVFSFIFNEYDKIKCFKKSVFGYIFGWTPEFFSCLGYIVSCGYPTRTHNHTRGNSVAHGSQEVMIYLQILVLQICKMLCIMLQQYTSTQTYHLFKYSRKIIKRIFLIYIIRSMFISH